MAQKPTYEELEQRIKELEKAEVEHNQAEETPRDSKGFFEFLSESSPLGVFQTDSEGRVLYLNNKWLEITGMSRDDALGFGWSEALHPEDRPRVLEDWSKCLEERIGYDGEFRFVRPTGEAIWTHTLTSPVFSPSGEVMSHVGVNEDISERKRIEEALRESEEKYRQLFELGSDAIFLIERETGDILEVNSTSTKLYDYSREELLQMKNTDLSVEPNKTQKATQTTRTRIPIRFHRKKDGTVFPVEITANHFLWHGKQVHIASIRDIAFRLEREEGKEKLERQLLQAQKTEAIATLAGGIAHQFNNALSPITLGLNLLEMDSPNDENIANYIEPMKGSARRMVQLTNQLLAYARGGKYQVETLSLSDFVRDTLPLIGHAIDPAIHIDTDLPHDIFSVEVDLTQMQMVLSAILTNASEAMESKGRIRINCRNETIMDETNTDVSDYKPGDYVGLMIEDDGKGMDEETRSRIFEPFFTTKFQGRGLGMAACYGIIKNHDGWISVDSELGKGTTVRVFLPATEAKLKEPRKPIIKPARGTGTILVIEDEERVIDITLTILAKLGYRVLAAKTGEEAISIAKTFDGDIDLAILDIGLPDMDGKSIYPLLMEARSNLRVLVCTGYSIDGPAQDILDAGAEDFIQKPFAIAELSEKLKKILKG